MNFEEKKEEMPFIYVKITSDKMECKEITLRLLEPPKISFFI